MYPPLVATLGYGLSADRAQVLLIHRTARADDQHLGTDNGLGGKLRRDEDVVAGMRREIAEEAGIECVELRLAGTVNWPGFGDRPGEEDWLGFIFRIDRFEGTPRASNPEGTLGWAPLSQLDALPMWEGDRHFLSLVFADPLRQFHGVMPYENGHPRSWTYSLV